jgi:hypothetical protein
MSALASATRTAFGEVALTFPYAGGEDLREALKTEIPSYYRRWDKDEKRWLILGAFGEQAISLLLEHYPSAEIPGDRVRPGRLVARTERPPEPALPLPPTLIEPRPADEQPELDHLVASVRCPRCHKRHDQPVRVMAESSLTVAKSERPPAEFIAICPSCNSLVAVAFYPAVASCPF